MLYEVITEGPGRDPAAGNVGKAGHPSLPEREVTVGERIRLLPDGVINQIAAGEVVTRPASVLKELLENAVDAGSNVVEVQVSGAYPFTLRVSDNGFGMEAGEVEAALRRHTTSKISTVEDLQRLTTFV